MLKNFAIIFGVIMLIIGILGFIPEANPNGLLFGIFHVNFEHNIVHITTGLISLFCGFTTEYASRIFFRIFGIVYAVVALLGLYYGVQPILGLLANNHADIVLHVIIAVIALYLGFIYDPPINEVEIIPKKIEDKDKELHL